MSFNSIEIYLKFHFIEEIEEDIIEERIDTGNFTVKIKCEHKKADDINKIKIGNVAIGQVKCSIIRLGKKLACKLCGSFKHLEGDIIRNCLPGKPGLMPTGLFFSTKCVQLHG